MPIYDLIIIGAGPAGITASVYAARKRLNFLVITLDVGGQAAWSGDIENYTGYQFITGSELVNKFAEHMRKYNIALKENEEVLELKKSVEVYYKTIENYLDYKSGAVLVMNHHIETDVIGTKGKAYGVELLLKKVTGKFNGWISYTWSRILLQQNDPKAGELINNGNPYPANYDKPNDLTVVTNYKFSHRVSISLNANYSTGRPITLPIGLFDYCCSMRTLYDDRNAYRIPDYFRTDFAMNIEGNHKVKQLFHNSWSIGVYNLTGRKNPYSVYYVSENGHVNGYKLSIFGNAIPYINLNIRFK